MRMTIAAIARADIRALVPYPSARMEAQANRVMLNANESPWPLVAELNRYPDPQPAELVNQLADLYKTTPERILVGRGSDEAIDLLVRAFCAAGKDAIAICPPTFAMYGVCARIQGAAVIEVALDSGFSVDVDALLGVITPEVKLIFLCSPNNPTGGCVPQASIVRILEAAAGRALVVVDEAYIEFAGDGSVIGLLEEFENLAVLRTLSKAFALASARIGALVAREEVIALLRRIQSPYPLPQPCVTAAIAALSCSGRDAAAARVEVIIASRDKLAAQLKALPNVREILPSAANFLCVRFSDSGEAYRNLLREGVVVRDVSRYPGLDNCLRISIGTPQENAVLLRALQKAGAA
jgi:histidinol-phosphate aminotransferase